MKKGSSHKIPAWRKTFFGAGEIGNTFSYTVISFFLLYYLTDVVGLRPGLAGAVMLIGQVWDAVTDPLMGHISDRTRSRWGRRRVYLLFGALPLGATFFLLWALPADWSQGAKFAYAAISYVMHMTVMTVVGVPYTSLNAEMTDDYDERTSLVSYRMLFSIVGGLAAVVAPDLVVGQCPTPQAGYLMMGLILGILIGIAPLFPFFGGTERKHVIQDEGGFSLFRDYKRVWRNRPFRLVILVFLMTWASIAVMEAMFKYYLIYALDMEDYFIPICGGLFGLATLFLPFWVWFSGKYGKRISYIFGIGVFAVFLPMTIFLRADLANTLFWLALGGIVLMLGFGVSAAHMIPHSMIPDVIDYGRLKDREDKEGLYYGFLSFAQKLASGGILGLTGLMLEWSGYKPPAEQMVNGVSTMVNQAQTPGALTAIRLLLGLFPALMLLVGVLCVVFYKIDKNTHQRIVNLIEQRRGG